MNNLYASRAKKDNFIMQVLKKANIDISRAAVMIMLEDDMLTEERLLTDYLAAKNINDALENPQYDEAKILSRNMEPEQAAILIKAYDSTSLENC